MRAWSLAGLPKLRGSLRPLRSFLFPSVAAEPRCETCHFVIPFQNIPKHTLSIPISFPMKTLRLKFLPIVTALSSLLALASLASFALPAPRATAAPWAEMRSDLPQDPALVLGTLPNGLRYALLPNASPANRVFLRLLVSAGSLHENDDERGIAHFIEHMAFRNTLNHPRSDLVATLQRAGLTFGADVNATTTYDNTLYQLDLPDASEKNIRDALDIFRDFASNIDFAPDAIATERGVILSEMSMRDTAAARVTNAYSSFIYPAARGNSRSPIGLENQIRAFTPQQFRAFYNAWYRPERMALIAVGNINPETLAKIITDTFGSLAARAPARAEPPANNTPPPSAPEFGVFIDKQILSPSFRFFNARLKSSNANDSGRASRLRNMTQGLAMSMLADRITKLVQQPDKSSYIGNPRFNYGSYGSLKNDLDNAQVAVPTNFSKWREAVALFEQILRRARENGFTQNELDDAKTRVAKDLEQAVRAAPTRPSDALATQLAAMFLNGDAFVAPEGYYKPTREMLAAITLENCNAAYAEMWGDNPPRLFISAGTRFTEKKEDTKIAQCLADSRKVSVAPAGASAAQNQTPDASAAQSQTQTQAKPDSRPRPAGRVLATRQVPEINATLAKLDNNVLLNFKRTDFEKDTVYVSVNLDGGLLTMPARQPGLSCFAISAFLYGGLKDRAYADIMRQLRESGIHGSLALGIGSNRNSLCGITTPSAQFKTTMEILAGYLASAGFRDEAAKTTRNNMPDFYTAINSSASANIAIPIIISDLTGDARFGMPAYKDYTKRTMTEARQWLAPLLANNGLEISIVGDISYDDALDATLKTFGALPARPECAAAKIYNEVKFVKKPGSTITKTIGATIKQAAFAYVWLAPASNIKTGHDKRVSNILASVIENAMQDSLRKQLGITYAANAIAYGDDAIPNCRCIIATAEAAPDALDKAIASAKESLAKLAREGVSENDFARAKNPAIESARQDYNTNDYWVNTALGDAQTNPKNLEDTLNRPKDYESITREEVNALAARVLNFDQAWLFKAVPKK